MEDVRLVLDLVGALAAACVGGLIAQRLGQPVLLGYVVAGVLIGENTPGFQADFERVQLMANLGAAFLMFALGVEFSFGELKRVQRIAFVSGGIQIPLTFLVGALAGAAAGWDRDASLLLGGAFAISSSIVALKLLLGRGEVESPQARIALGLGIVQDLSLVPMLALVPVLSDEGGNVAVGVLRSIGIAGGALIAVAVLGTRFVPRALYFVARTESRELFIVTVVLIALGTAYASHEAGLSLALGAFLAGLVVSESEFDSQVLAEIIPLRDLFATLFFVSLGMLIEPGLVLDKWPLILGLAAALVVGKTLITGAAFLTADVDHRTATLGALTLAQIGEFSFVLAGVGLSEAILDRDQYALVLEVALVTILVAPILYRFGPALIALAEYLPGVQAQESAHAGPEPPEAESEPLSRHVVICGFGRVGMVLGEILARRGFRYAVIELNPAIVRDLRARGIRAYYGDAASEALLLRAGVDRARTVAVTSNDLVAARAAVMHARHLNPTIDVVTRARVRGEVDVLKTAGADEVVQPEFEAGLEFVRHVLRRQGVSNTETSAILARRRADFYESPEGRSVFEEDT